MARKCHLRVIVCFVALAAGASAFAASSANNTSPQQTQERITEWAFDFGPKGSPTFAGFCAVDSHCVYSKATGFGWIPYRDGRPMVESNYGPSSSEVPGLGERDRGGVGSDSLYRDFVSTSAYYHTQVRQTFAVNVPNGVYRVMTFHGDTQFGRPGRQSFWIEAEGRKVVRSIFLPPSLCTHVVFDVPVRDGRLELTFDASHKDPARRGFFVNGLVILPAGTPAEKAFADERIATIQAAIQQERHAAFAATFKEVPYVETGTMVEPTPADRERGFIAWTPNWMETLYPNSVPKASDVEHPFSAFAALGEYEPVVVALRALRPLRGVRVQVGTLRGPRGYALPASAVEVRVVTCWPQRIGSSWSKEYRILPELLEKKPSVDVPAETTQAFWLTIHVPERAVGGFYQCPVRLVTAEGGRWEKTLSLEVLPVKLAPPERWVGMYWRDELWDEKTLERQVRDMVSHGMNVLTISRSPKIANVGGKLVVNTSELLSFLRWLRRLGITGPIPYNNSFESLLKRAFPEGDFDSLYVELIRQLEKVSNHPEALKLLYYPVDEIGNDEKRGEKAAYLCSLIAKVPGATSYITVNNYAAGEKWGDSFSIWCGNIPYTQEQEQKLLARGKRYMRYGSAYLNDCRKARASCGFGFAIRPAEAMYYWHYQAYNGDPFNDFDGEARDWCAVYPGPTGELIPTMDWEALREGVDDLRYIATLKRWAARAERGNPAQRAAAAKAYATLAEVLSTDDTLVQTAFGEKLSLDEYHALRRRLADEIVALVSALKQ